MEQSEFTGKIVIYVFQPHETKQLNQKRWQKKLYILVKTWKNTKTYRIN